MSAALDRRTFLAGTAALGLVPWLARRGRVAVRGTAIGAGLVGEGVLERNVLCLLDLDDPLAGARRIPVDFYGHGIAIDPRDPTRAALFQKGGPGACALDLAGERVLRPIPVHPERDFYGHGVFSPDGAVLYTTERVVAERYLGVIAVRDADTLEEIGLFPSFGVNPHDCVLVDRGRTLVVTNGGGPGRAPEERPSVSYVDVASRRLLERVPIEDPDMGAGHLALTADGDLAVVSAERGGLKTRDGVGAVSLRPRGGELRTLTEPRDVTARLRGEALSVSIHEPSGVVGVTHPFGGMVTFWDLRERRLLSTLELAYPRGIALALDGSSFVVSYGRSTSVVEVSTATLEPVPGSRRSGLSMQSSHVIVHRLAASAG